jgi:GNAT superfamily N-acetyltransferase
LPADQKFLDGLKRRVFDPTIDVSKFTCQENVKWFITASAPHHHGTRVSTVTCWTSGDDLVGYVATSMKDVHLKEDTKLDEADRKAILGEIRHTEAGPLVKRVPAVHIGMLGVCERFQRRGIGGYMVQWVIGKALEVGDEIGCRFVTVDSLKTEQAVALYSGARFRRTTVERDNNVLMYLDLGPRG